MAYFGSKATSGLCQPIITLMPPHDTHIETHLCGGAIMQRKPPALHNIGIDLVSRALATFECDFPVERIHGCAHRFLTEFDYRGSELVYCDPPYLRRTRTSARRYRFDYEESDHIELLTLLKSLPCQVILSGYVGDYATALREFLPLAEAGNPFAQYNLGNMYDDGKVSQRTMRRSQSC